MNLVLTECDGTEIATHGCQNNLYFEVYLPHHTLLSSSVDDVILIAAWEGEESTLRGDMSVYLVPRQSPYVFRSLDIGHCREKEREGWREGRERRMEGGMEGGRREGERERERV